MKTLIIMLVLGLAGLGFSTIMQVTGSTPMTCLKDCCANACGNGQWDSDSGFCHGPQDNTSACVSCQSDCRAGIKPHIAGEQTTNVSVVNNSAPAQNATQPKANTTKPNGSTQIVHANNSQPAHAAAASTATQGFDLQGLWIVIGAILAIIVLAILLLGIKI
jgi:cobalamin biosynthesis Mg chelatase CobN